MKMKILGLPPITWWSVIIMFVIGGIAWYYASKNEKVKKILPGIYTALGLLGTFIALAVSFLNLDISDNSEIEELPKKLATAFITSIIGIMAAQITNWLISKKEQENYNTKSYLKEEPEEVLFSLRNISKTQATDINTLKASMENQLGVNKLFLKELKALRSDFSLMANTVTQEFSNTMQTLNANVVKDATELNKNLAEHTLQLQSEYKSLIAESSKTLQQNQKNEAELLKNNLIDINQSFKDDVSSFQSKLLEQMSTSLNQQKTALDAGVNNQKDALEKSINEFTELRKQTKEDSLKYISGLKITQDAIIEYQKEAQQESMAELANLRNQTKEETLELISELNSTKKLAIKKTEEITNQLASQFSELLESIKNLQDHTEKSVNASSSRLKKSAELYDMQKDKQSEVLETIKGQLERIDQLIEERNMEREKYQFYEKRTDTLHDSIELLTSATVSIKTWVESQVVSNV